MRISDWSSDVCSSDLDALAVHGADRALARGRVEVGDLGNWDATILRGRNDRERQGMLRRPLDARRKTKKIVLRKAIHRHDACHRRSPLDRKSTRLNSSN